MGKHTGQGQELVANEDCGVVLVFIQGILTPVPQELLHIEVAFADVALVGSVMNDETWKKRKLKTGGRWKMIGRN